MLHKCAQPPHEQNEKKKKKKQKYPRDESNRCVFVFKIFKRTAFWNINYYNYNFSFKNYQK